MESLKNKVERVTRGTSYFLPIVIAAGFILFTGSSWEKNITVTFGNGSLLIPLGIILFSILVKRFNDFPPYILITLALISLANFAFYGATIYFIIEEGGTLNWIVTLAITFAYFVAALKDLTSSHEISMNEHT